MNSTEIKDHLTNTMQWAASGSKLTYASIGIGLLVALILFRFFFKSLPGLFHCIGFSFGTPPNAGVPAQPGVSKLSRVKLLLGALLPAGSGYAAYVMLPRLFPTIFQ
jgi:hypothetical protein